MFSRLEFNLHALCAMVMFLVDKLLCGLLIKSLSGDGSDYVPWPQGADLRNKVIIVTGSNTGIGKATAEQLVKFGATVVLACRDEQKGLAAEKELNDRAQCAVPSQFPFAYSGRAVFMKLNLGDLHHVWSFSCEFRKQFSRLDAIVNNAGLNVDEVLPNGLKQLFQVNYLSHYLLFRSLQSLLVKSRDGESSGRVVNLSSVMHHCGHPNYKVSALSNISSAFTTSSSSYDDSKMFMNLFTMEINRRYSGVSSSQDDQAANGRGRPILAISANPGAVLSDIWRHLPFQPLVRAVFRIFFLNTWQGSATSVYAVCVDEERLKQLMHPIGDQARHNTGGRMHFHRYLPYLIPYFMPYRFLAFEIMGPFAGPRFSYASLPTRSDAFRVRSISRLSHNQRSYSGNNLGNVSVGDLSSDSGPNSRNGSNVNLTGLDPMLTISSRASSRMVEFASPEDLALQLWKYSSYLCHKILLLSGVPEDQLLFLKD